MNNSLHTTSICPKCEKLVYVDLVEAELEQSFCSHCGESIPMYGAIGEMNDQTLRILIKKSPKPLVVDFYAGWCVPCKEYLPVFCRFASENIDAFIFAKISVEFNPVLAQSYSIKGIPHTLVFIDGQESERKVGVLDENTLFEVVNKYRK